MAPDGPKTWQFFVLRPRDVVVAVGAEGQMQNADCARSRPGDVNAGAVAAPAEKEDVS